MIVDIAQVERALSPLVGLPLCGSSRAADLQMFDFGGTRTRVRQFGPRKGETAEVHDFSLHVQCGWRVRGPAGIVVGATDLRYRSGDDPYGDDNDWDYQLTGASRRDQRIAAWLRGAPFEVLRVHADEVGGCVIELAGRFTLDVFPEHSLDGEYSEHWRLLRPDSHCVVSGRGIDD
jgi:hypothetical protein